MKRCFKCKLTKSLVDFCKDRTTKDGHCKECKTCRAEYQKSWRKNDPERASKVNKLAWQRYKTRYQENNKAWLAANKSRRNAYHNQRRLRKFATDESFRWKYKIRTKVYLSLRGLRKSAPTEKLIGCTFDELRRYLAMQFEPWMNWDNWGYGDGHWVIDHKHPLASFDLSDPDQQKLAWHYTNLRPLAWRENLMKADKLEFQIENKKERERLSLCPR